MWVGHSCPTLLAWNEWLGGPLLRRAFVVAVSVAARLKACPPGGAGFARAAAKSKASDKNVRPTRTLPDPRGLVRPQS
jgi:hypothetical protein